MKAASQPMGLNPSPSTRSIGCKQAVGMIVLQVALDAFRAEPAFVERKFLPRLEPDDLVVLNQQA